FWATVKAKTINGEVQLQALMDGKKIIITEFIMRRDIQLEDVEGIDCLPNATIFEQLTLMGYEKVSQKLTFYKAFFSPQWKFLIHTVLQCLSAKTTAWNEFSSTMASAIICLATNQKFNFSKYIFESMVKNLENVSGKFLMYPRFVQVFLEKQLEGMSNHKRIYVTPSHTKKIFGNMRRVGKGFSGRETPLFQTMVVQHQEEMGEGSANPTDPHHTPTIIQPSTSQPQKKQKPRRPKRKDTEIPQSSGPTDNVADEAVNEEMDDSLERAATTATSLDAEQDRGNINKTQSKATPNEPSSLGTSSGGGPRRQETMGDTIAQTRLKLEELMEFCTKLQQRVLNIENTKTAQAQEITSLKLRVKKLGKKGGLRTHKLKILYKVGRSARMVSSDDASLGDQECIQTGEEIDDIDKDAEITLIDETQRRYGDDLMFDTSVLDDEEVFAGPDMDEKEINVAEKEVSIADPVTTAGEVVTTASPTKTTTADDLTLAQTLIEIKSAKSKDKSKGIMEEPEKPTKKKDQIRHDEGVSQRLQAQMQAELEEEDRLNKSFDDIQKLFDKAMKRVNTFVDMDTKLVEEVVPDKEEVAIDDIPLATKPSSIVDYKIHKEGKKNYYQIIMADGSSKMYLVFSHMLKSFDREDLKTLWKLVKAKHGSTRPEEGYDRVLWGDLKTMFDPHIEDQVWRNQQDYRVLDWKIYDSCGVHSLRMQHMHIHMLVEKRYPLTPATITDMLNKKLQCDHFSEMVINFLKTSHITLKNHEVFGSILLVIKEAFNEET
ncbi:hypothetical protein Tco_0576787, partial [Tanacetum coccineum]